MKRRIISLLLTFCMVVGLFSVIPFNAFAATNNRFSDREIIYGDYGVIYFTLANADFTDRYGYINSEPINSCDDANSVLYTTLGYHGHISENVQSVNIVLTKDWTTEHFIFLPSIIYFHGDKAYTQNSPSTAQILPDIPSQTPSFFL